MVCYPIDIKINILYKLEELDRRYMAIDMQYFVLSPILLTIYWRKPIAGELSISLHLNLVFRPFPALPDQPNLHFLTLNHRSSDHPPPTGWRHRLPDLLHDRGRGIFPRRVRLLRQALEPRAALSYRDCPRLHIAQVSTSFENK